jgi:hypothetical protein
VRKIRAWALTLIRAGVDGAGAVFVALDAPQSCRRRAAVHGRGGVAVVGRGAHQNVAATNFRE